MADQWWLIAGADSLQVHYLPNQYWGQQLDGIGLPPVEHIKQRSPRQDGATRVDTILRERAIDIGWVQSIATRNGYWESRFGLYELLKQFDNLVLRIILESGESYDIDVAYLAEARRRLIPNSSMIALRLEAANPIFRATDPDFLVVGVPPSVDDFEFAIEFPETFGVTAIDKDIPLAYLGTWPAYPQIDISGPITDPLIRNDTTDEELELSAVVPDGEVVRITLDPWGKSVWNITTDTNWMQYLDADSDLATWHLEAAPTAVGGINDLHFSGTAGGAASAITLRWHDQFIGAGKRP